MVLRLMTGWAIILSLRWARRRTFTSDLGIHMGKRDIGLGGASLLVVGVIASYAIPKILRPLGYAPGISNDQTWKYLATPFQVLNEEMVVRAFLLTILLRMVNRPITVSVVTAALFYCLETIGLTKALAAIFRPECSDIGSPFQG